MSQQIIYVKQDAVGENNGSSWENAYTDLQEALAVAPPDSEVWVARGIYIPTLDDDRTISFYLPDGVAIYGGFAGDETTSDERNWQENETILSGDIGDKNDNSDNTYSVVTVIYSSAILDGFTITDGNSDTEFFNAGGGIYNAYSQVTLTNLKFLENNAVFNGGAIYNTFSTVSLSNVDIRNNTADENGGGIYNYKSNLTLTNVVVSDNQANNVGGGITLDLSQNVNLTNVLIVNNIADNGGGIYNLHSQVNLVNVTVSNNIAQTGGGIESFYDDSQITITNSILWGNQAQSVSNPLTSQIANVKNSTIQITDSIVQGDYGTQEDGNLDVDPLFVSVENGDFRIQSSSPAIDRGVNQVISEDLTVDLDNNLRISGLNVDLGAYEFPPTEDLSFKIDAAQYGASHLDLIRGYGYDLIALEEHYLQFGQFEGRNLDNFDELRYIASNPDLIPLFGTDGTAATEHYIRHGITEDRPTTTFNSEAYLASYDDLLDGFGNDPQVATIHYLENGFSENRKPDLFDAARYIASYDDLIEGYHYNLEAGIEHYLNFGRAEGRSYSSFDPLTYLNKYSDLQAAFEGDLVAATRHYIEYGFKEGRIGM